MLTLEKKETRTAKRTKIIRIPSFLHSLNMLLSHICNSNNSKKIENASLKNQRCTINFCFFKKYKAFKQRPSAFSAD